MVGVVDAHVHFWDPAELDYPWVAGIPALQRAFLPGDYARAAGDAPVAKIVFVECNCRPDQSAREVAFARRLAETEPRLAGIVAFTDLTDPDAWRPALAALSRSPLVKGARHNIQGQPAGFCLAPAFVEGVRAVGKSGLTFDLCATHDQLRDVAELVRRCPETPFVLDHCGKPAITDGRAEPWSADIARLAAHENVCCKLSGLLTEAGPERRRDDDLIPYAARVLECFGVDRLLYGSDWPVVTLAGTYCDWYGFTRRFTETWSPEDRQRFYYGNAVRVYRV